MNEEKCLRCWDSKQLHFCDQGDDCGDAGCGDCPCAVKKCDCPPCKKFTPKPNAGV